MLEIGFRIF